MLIVSFSCSLSGKNYSGELLNTSNIYKVYKIDSINSYYLIYAKKEDSIFKIVSKKQQFENCNIIKENGEYEFDLHSSLFGRNIGGESIPRPNSLMVNCFSYDDSTKICLEKDSIIDLFYGDNIEGLCFKIK